MPTLDWFIHKSTLNNLQLLTGQSHSTQKIYSVNVLDNPDVLKWFKRDELILTTGFVFKDDVNLQRSIIQDMKGIGCAALCIKIRRFFRSIPQPLLDEAQRLDFPVIEIPFFYSFSEISQRVFQQIYQESKDQPQRDQDFLIQLMNNMLHHESLSELLQQISTYLALPVLLLDIYYSPLTSSQENTMHPLSPELLKKISYTLSHNTAEPPISAFLPIEQTPYRLQLLSLPNQTGYLCLIHQENESSLISDEFLKKVLQMLTFACEQSNIARLSYENRSSFFLHFLMHQNKGSLEEIKNLCAFYGFDYLKSWICLTLSLQNFLPENKTVFIQTLRNLFPQYIPEEAKHFLCANDNLFCCFFLFPTDCHRLHALHEVQKKVQLLQERLSHITNITIAMGISGCHTNVSDIRLSFQESLQAMNLQQQLHQTELASYLHQLPSHMLSDYRKNTGVILKHNILKPLLDFDKSSQTDLTYTLKIYFDCTYNASQAAKELYLHRNTMLNRLEKIKELLDTDFSNATENFLIYLSLLALQLEK